MGNEEMGPAIEFVRRPGVRGALLAACAAVLAPTAPAVAQCQARLLQHYGGEASIVDRAGDRMYAIFGDELFVYDVANVDTPLELGRLPIAGDHLRDLVASPSYAYVAAGTSGLVVVEATDPMSPTIAARLELAEPLGLLAKSGSNIIATQGGSSTYTDVYIIDVSTPSSPTLRSTYVPRAGVYGVMGLVAQGDTIFCCTNLGIEVVDIAIPTAPVRTNIYQSSRRFGRAALADNTLICPREYDRVDILDVTTPTAIQFLGSFPVTHSGFGEVAINPAGMRVYFSSDTGTGLTSAWDISSAASPVQTDTVPFARDGGHGNQPVCRP